MVSAIRIAPFPNTIWQGYVNSKLKYNFFTSHTTIVSTAGRKNIKIPMLYVTNARNQIKCKNFIVVTLIIHRQDANKIIELTGHDGDSKPG